jgi:hypothetical protein
MIKGHRSFLGIVPSITFSRFAAFLLGENNHGWLMPEAKSHKRLL